MNYPDDFLTFWRFYPRKVSKPDALKAWNQTAQDRPPLPELLETLYDLMTSDQWNRERGRYIPYPATWLRREGWEERPTQTTEHLRQYQLEQLKRDMTQAAKD